MVTLYAGTQGTFSVPRNIPQNVIFGKSFVPLFDGGTGKVKRNLYVWHFSEFFFSILDIF